MSFMSFMSFCLSCHVSVCLSVCLATYYLHRKSGILGEKFKWYVPFHWKIFENFGKSQTYSFFLHSNRNDRKSLYLLRLPSRPRLQSDNFSARLATSPKQNGGQCSYIQYYVQVNFYKLILFCFPWTSLHW